MTSQTIIRGFDPYGPFGDLFLPLAIRERQKQTRFKQKWELTFEQYAALMQGKPIPPKRNQLGHVILALAAWAPSAGVVVLNTHSFSSTGTPTVTSGVIFESDGGLTERDSESGNVDQSGEWWSLEPVTAIGSQYDVEALSAGKVGTWSNAAAVDDTPIQINVNRQWDVQRNSSGTTTASATFEIQKTGTGTAEDSATISCQADV